MPRAHRFHLPGHVWHLTHRCHDRAFLLKPECGSGERVDCYRPRQQVAFTTGTAFGMKGEIPLLNADGSPGMPGEPFDCALWATADGPGQLIQGLAEFDKLGGNVTTAFRIDD